MNTAVIHTYMREIPANNEFSIRHNTRNFIYREGARPGDGQHAWVGLMDARSIAATALHGGRLTAATELNVSYTVPPYRFDRGIYEKRVYNGIGNPKPETVLIEGPNIKPWPEMEKMPEHLLLKVCSYIDDEVTTTDELIPSGDTSSYRSNPIQMSSLTLYRRDPDYVGRAKAVQDLEKRRQQGEDVWKDPELRQILDMLVAGGMDEEGLRADIGIGSAIYARKPGDGSAREQAASCQKVLGGMANLTETYATRRYRANLINWGVLPFELVNPSDKKKLSTGVYLFLRNIRHQLQNGKETMEAQLLDGSGESILLTTGELSRTEREILLAGCMINYCRR